MRKKDPACSNTNVDLIRKKLEKIASKSCRDFLKIIGFGIRDGFRLFLVDVFSKPRKLRMASPCGGSHPSIDKRPVPQSPSTSAAVLNTSTAALGALLATLPVNSTKAETIDKDPIDSKKKELVVTPTNNKKVLSSSTIDFAKAEKASTDNNKESAEVVNGPGDYEFLPNPVPYDELTPERSEALKKKRVMYVPILITENAKADIEAVGGNVLDAVKKNTDSLEEFMKNCGGDLECEVQPTVIIIPDDQYADLESQSGEEARAFMNTNLTSGSWLDQELTTIADTQGVPRDKMYPYMFARNMASFALTNFGNPGVVMRATEATHPTLHDKQQRETGPHELAKQYGFENANSPWEYDVPTDSEGNLIYDFRRSPNDGAPIKKIVSPTYTIKPGEFMQELLFLPKVHSGPNGKVQLYDQKSGTMIELPYGDETHDAWHSATWERLDEFTHEVVDNEAPAFNLESFSPSGTIENINNVILSLSLLMNQ